MEESVEQEAATKPLALVALIDPDHGDEPRRNGAVTGRRLPEALRQFLNIDGMGIDGVEPDQHLFDGHDEDFGIVGLRQFPRRSLEEIVHLHDA
jgi:hypothetical protein